jgi:hypothetical protein
MGCELNASDKGEVMHTRCCEEQKFQTATIRIGQRFDMFVTNFATVPCFLEVRFKCPNLAAGNLRVATFMPTDVESMWGDGRNVRGFAQINEDLADFGTSGFIAEFPDGVGGGVTLINNLSQDISDVKLSLRYKFTTVESLSTVKGR